MSEKTCWEIIGTHDLRLDASTVGGFHHVALRDADDGDVIIVNEDDLTALRDRLTEIINNMENEGATKPIPSEPTDHTEPDPDLQAA